MRVEKKVEKKEELPVQKPGLLDKEQPQSMVKILVLAVLAVLAAGLFWFLLANILQHGISFSRGQNNAIMILWVILAFCLMFAIVGLAAVMIKNTLLFLLIAIVSAGAYLVFFKFNIWSIGTLLLFIVAFLYWRQAVQSDMKSRIKFMPKKVMSTGMHSALALVILGISFAYVGFFVQSQGGSNKVVDGIAKATANIVNNVMPMVYKGYRPSMTLDEFILTGTSSITSSTLNNLGTNQESQKVINEVITKAQQQVVDESRDQFLKTFNIQAAGNEPMRSVIEKVVSSKFDPILKPYEKFIPIIIVLSIYFLLSIFLFIYKILVESFSFIIFMVMKWTKFVQIKKVSVEADRLTL